MSYFTAVFKDLPQDELAAIAQDERCRFIAHSHVGHKRDELRQRVAELELIKSELTNYADRKADEKQDLFEQLAASQECEQQLRQRVAAQYELLQEMGEALEKIDAEYMTLPQYACESIAKYREMCK